MKKLGCLFIIIAVAVVMFLTNPNEKQHVDNAFQILKERRVDDLGLNADYLTIGEGLLGKDQMNNLIKKFIVRKNYYFFSLTQLDLGQDKRTIGLGIFGHIFMIDDL